MQQYVGIDLHRRRSVIVRMDENGETLERVRMDNDPIALALEIAKAGPDPEVVLEATYGWYWAADVLEAEGARVHLAHPLGVKAFSYQRVKNDAADARQLADLLRMGRLPEAWVAPPQTRELRELIRYRAKLVSLTTGLKSQAYSVFAKEGVRVPVSDLFGARGQRLMDDVSLAPAYERRVTSLRSLARCFDREVGVLNRDIRSQLVTVPGYWAIQDLCGVGPVLAAVFIAEIGDAARFANPRRLCSWAGLTPRHRESDEVVHRGHITKQGSRLVRWAAVEAAQKIKVGSKHHADFHRIAAGRGDKIARVAIARKILTLVYYGLRDGEIRCLQKEAA
jgi:transposase